MAKRSSQDNTAGRADKQQFKDTFSARLAHYYFYFNIKSLTTNILTLLKNQSMCNILMT